MPCLTCSIDILDKPFKLEIVWLSACRFACRRLSISKKTDKRKNSTISMLATCRACRPLRGPCGADKGARSPMPGGSLP